MKILASDFDGTIFFHDIQGFKQEDLNKINEFQDNGNKFGICTGRPLLGITEPTNGLIKYDFYILNTGAYILDKDCQVIFKKTLSISTIKRVIQETEFSQGIHLAGVKDIHVLSDMPNWPKDVKRPSNIDEVEDEILAFSLHTDNDENQANQLTTFINEHYNELSAFQNKGDIDIVARGCSKGHALKILADHYQITKDDMYCIGDSYNDIPMLESLENSFTFNDSPPIVKDKAHHIVATTAECINKIEKD